MGGPPAPGECGVVRRLGGRVSSRRPGPQPGTHSEGELSKMGEAGMHTGGWAARRGVGTGRADATRHLLGGEAVSWEGGRRAAPLNGKRRGGFVAGGGCSWPRNWGRQGALPPRRAGQLASRRPQPPGSSSRRAGGLSRSAAACTAPTSLRRQAYALMAAPSQVRLGRRSRSFCFSLGSLMLEARPHFSSCLMTTQVMSHW